MEHCEGIHFCIKEIDGNLFVEVSKADIQTVMATLQAGFENVAPLRLAHPMLPYLHGFILVKPMVSEAPLVSIDGVPIPATEKELVDQLADWEYEHKDSAQKKKDFQHIIETRSVHLPKLMRYERENSDIDLLVSLDRPVSMGLFGFSELIMNLEKATGKSIDLVVEGTEKPFAKPSIERDKVLIYERT